MKKLFAILAVFFVLVCCLSSCGKSDYAREQETKREAIYQSGYEDGRDEGRYDGYEDGYDEGYDEGYYVGYDDGHSDGYYDGATYTCLSFGDVDRAFQTALNGSAWYSFVDAYDQYISNIYDDNDTRIELIWTLVSATLSEDGATKEEKELLISTFGKDLFTRNGIALD